MIVSELLVNLTKFRGEILVNVYGHDTDIWVKVVKSDLVNCIKTKYPLNSLSPWSVSIKEYDVIKPTMFLDSY